MQKYSIVILLFVLCGCQRDVKIEVTTDRITTAMPQHLDAAARTQYIAFAAQLHFQQQLTNQFEIEQKYDSERETKVALVVTWVGSLLIVCSAFVAVLCLLFKIWVQEQDHYVANTH